VTLAVDRKQEERDAALQLEANRSWSKMSAVLRQWWVTNRPGKPERGNVLPVPSERDQARYGERRSGWREELGGKIQSTKRPDDTYITYVISAEAAMWALHAKNLSAWFLCIHQIERPSDPWFTGNGAQAVKIQSQVRQAEAEAERLFRAAKLYLYFFVETDCIPPEVERAL
jgi:hypothetical protein